jgi:hypothetical protein
MSNPIEHAKALTPFWMRDIHQFDGLEIHPCRAESVEKGTPFIEQCTPESAEFWSVYGHYKTGGVSCFEDFPTKAQARAFAARLLEAWPHHLTQCGLSRLDKDKDGIPCEKLCRK